MIRGESEAEAEKALRTIPYLPADRRTDARRGRRDGRKRIPSFTTLTEQLAAGARTSTPYQDELTREVLVRINDEHGMFLARMTVVQDRIARARAALEAGLELIERGREALIEARADLTEEELLPRSPQELALAGTPALHGRRAAMRDKRIAAAQAELDRRQAAVDACRQEISAAYAHIDHDFARTQARARRLADYYVLRIVSYWDAVVQTHPEGRNLSSALPPASLQPPAWVDATCQDGVITEPLAEEGAR
jgi:hypothetical protein